MKSKEVLGALVQKVLALVKEINRKLGEEYLYLTSDLGFFRLYRADKTIDRLVMAGRNNIEGLSRLVLRLESASDALH